MIVKKIMIIINYNNARSFSLPYFVFSCICFYSNDSLLVLYIFNKKKIFITMTSQSWLTAISNSEKTCIIEDGKRKVHYKFTDGREMVEEYSMDTNVVLKRAWKITKKFGSQPKWESEIGDPDPIFAEEIEKIGIKESSLAPFTTARITKNCLEWRIRNLPYPVDNYDVTADANENCIVVRTKNKKFFKKIPVLDLQRIGVKVEQERIEISHKFNTLIISYKKPPALVLSEKLIFEEINKIKTVKESDQCKQS